MKNKQQQGSAHLVVIILLVVVVLGTLGFIFWQNFIKKDAPVASTNTSATATTPTASDPAATPTEKTLTISSWGVKGTYTGDSTFKTVVQPLDGGSSMMNLTGGPTISEACVSVYPGGTVSRSTADQGAIVGSTASGKTAAEAYSLGYGTARAHVGDYYYFYTGPQAACGDADGEAAIQAYYNAYISIVSSLQAV